MFILFSLQLLKYLKKLSTLPITVDILAVRSVRYYITIFHPLPTGEIVQ